MYVVIVCVPFSSTLFSTFFFLICKLFGPFPSPSRSEREETFIGSGEGRGRERKRKELKQILNFLTQSKIKEKFV